MKKNQHVKVKRSKAGLGLFAETGFKKDDFVIEYTGKRLTDDQADLKGGKYLFILKKNLVIDGTTRKNTARYINHSCRPNCYPEIDEKKEKINIYAKKKIEPGEELTYHYGKEYWLDHCQPCKCEKCLGN